MPLIENMNYAVVIERTFIVACATLDSKFSEQKVQ